VETVRRQSEVRHVALPQLDVVQAGMLQGDPGHRRFVVPKDQCQKMGPRKRAGADQIPPERSRLKNRARSGRRARHPNNG